MLMIPIPTQQQSNPAAGVPAQVRTAIYLIEMMRQQPAPNPFGGVDPRPEREHTPAEQAAIGAAIECVRNYLTGEMRYTPPAPEVPPQIIQEHAQLVQAIKGGHLVTSDKLEEERTATAKARQQCRRLKRWAAVGWLMAATLATALVTMWVLG